jgi:ATP-dependent RNA helicase DDX46/PRP5
MNQDDINTNSSKNGVLSKEEKLKQRREQLAAWRLKKEQEKKQQEQPVENDSDKNDNAVSSQIDDKKLSRQQRIEAWKRKREKNESRLLDLQNIKDNKKTTVSLKTNKIGVPVLKKAIKRKIAFGDESEEENDSGPKFKKPTSSKDRDSDQDDDVDLDEYVHNLIAKTSGTRESEIQVTVEESGEEDADDDLEELEDEDESKQKLLSAKLKKLQNEKELTEIDHSRVNYLSFRKIFYQESSELSALSSEEVDLIRFELDNIKVKGEKCPKPILKWSNLGLPHNYMQVIEDDLKYLKPSSIQAQALPAIMSGLDVIGIAKTGSGKTISFILPMLRHVLDQQKVQQGEGPIGLIMTPTRELALQIYREIQKFTKALPQLRVLCCYGGSSIEPQIASLKKGCEIVIGTPGRIIDLLTANGGRITNLNRTTYVVLDEADRMFDMGFEPQVTKIFTQLRPDRQTILFSATFPKKMEILAKKILNNPIEITVGGISIVASEIEQKVEIFREPEEADIEKLQQAKFEKLLQILEENNNENNKILIFVEKQVSADNLLVKLVGKGIASLVIHGGKDQLDRKYAIKEFSKPNSGFNILIATSIAARGLDVKGLNLVINFDAANHMEDYVHRVGRTGRAGQNGTAITFIGSNQGRAINDLVKAMKLSKSKIPPELLNLYQKFMDKVKLGEEKPSFGFGGKGLEKLDEMRYVNKNLQKRIFGEPEVTTSEKDQAPISSNCGSQFSTMLPDFEIIEGRAPETSGPDKCKFHSRIIINDLPQTARWSIVNRESLQKIIESTGTSITNKGQFYANNTKPPKGDDVPPKLYLLVEGLTEASVHEANNLIRDRMIYGLELAAKENKMAPTTKYTV